MDNKLVIIFGIIGNIMSFIVYLSPISTFRKIYVEKSITGHTFMPYVVALFCSSIWIYYGSLDHNGIIISINIIGCIIETLYITMYIYYAPRDIKEKIEKIIGLGIVFVLVTIIVTYFTFQGQFRSSMVGWIGTLFSVVASATPIKIVIKVFRTRNNEFVPIQLLCCSALNALAWLAYGLACKDPVITISNVAGFVVCVLQMVVWWAFRQPPPPTTAS